MAGKGVRFVASLVLLSALAAFGSGFALPAPDPPVPSPSPAAAPAAVKDITMREFIAMEKDRPFDYSFSFRFVKRGGTAYYVRFSSLYLCEGPAATKLLDNARIYWMFIDDTGDLWFCVPGNADISGGELVERRALYRYDRADGRFVLVKEESDDCTFSNRFYWSCFLYWERGYLKAYATSGAGVYVLARTDDPAVYGSPDGEAIFYSDSAGRMVRLTGLKREQRKRKALDAKDFPLDVYTFEESIIVNEGNRLSYYRFVGTGYVKVCDFASPPGKLYESGCALYAVGGGICAVEAPYRASVRFYSFSTKSWSLLGRAEQADAYGYGGGACWFYTRTGTVRLYVIQGGKESEYSFGDLADGCSSIRVIGGMAYLFQYDEDWLTHALNMDTRELYRISD